LGGLSYPAEGDAVHSLLEALAVVGPYRYYEAAARRFGRGHGDGVGSDYGPDAGRGPVQGVR